MTKVFVAGYFDPPHPGHLALFEFAKKCVDDAYVIVAIHTPDTIIKKSGFYIYAPSELKVILRGYTQWIDEVIIAEDTDGSVVKTLQWVQPKIFVKGPDRSPQNMPREEIDICAEIGCTIVYQSGQKVNNSSSIKSRIRAQLIPNFKP
jgi:cytidyltransferase-like protein